MSAEIINSFIQEAFSNINIVTVVLLMAVGFMVKHIKLLEKVSNDLIPVILIVISIIVTLAEDGASTQSFITAIVSAAVAIGLHQSGKNIFTVSIVPSIVNKLGKDEEETTDDNEEEQ